MKYPTYDFSYIEPEILNFWKEESMREKVNEHNACGNPFYFLDGPPYTTGSVHIGTAWNKSMKDVLIRYKRMQGFSVWDRAGYDMHGLPNEHAAMKELELKTKEEIEEYGVQRFADFTRDLAVRRLKEMNTVFERLGVWMDFENAYQTISDEWITAVWWLIKQAHAKGRLYEGLRPMYWDPEHESALAKHELFYKEVEDTSIYVKFESTDTPKEYFVVWTTTPWTIPFNLMIMVHPEETYAKVQVGEERWIIAKVLVESVLEYAGREGKIIETVAGKELIGRSYTHFFENELNYALIKKEHPKIHSVVGSTEYVTTESGSGLVHGAPGCGPEDYEVGVQEGIPAFNLLDERGCYLPGSGRFSGIRARFEDKQFIEAIKESGNLVATQQYVHDYPFAQRSKSPIVYKATKQWFFKIDDLKEQMIKQNNGVHWMPQAGFNAFNSWLENLRDNSITKQRFWGTPFPIWKNIDDEDDIIVIGSKKELEEFAAKPVVDLHKPAIDDVEIVREGKTYRRMPDVIDVWVDAGVASWACLGYPQQTEAFERYFPADFIIEGNDQVRGWFNLLMIAGTLGFDQVPFNNVYMHGMIQDAQGRKMSKSLGNYILPEEVISKYGADAFRYSAIGGTKAGQDLTYSFDDCQSKHRNLMVFWNVHKYLLDLHGQVDHLVQDVEYSFADKYILSKAHSTIQEVHAHIEEYALDRIPLLVEDLLLEISRTYIQLVRPIISLGSPKEKKRTYDVLYEVFFIGLRLLAPITPFSAEAMYQNLLQTIPDLTLPSIHMQEFPMVNEKFIDTDLEKEMQETQEIISLVLSARDGARIGVRWPLQEIILTGVKKLSQSAEGIICEQANIKQITYAKQLPLDMEIAPNYQSIGKEFGQQTAHIVTYLKSHAANAAKEFEETKKITHEDFELNESHLKVTFIPPKNFGFAQGKSLQLLLNLEQTQELIAQGQRRELIRHIQQLRKKADLEKEDVIHLHLGKNAEKLIHQSQEEIMQITGADAIDFVENVKTPHHAVLETKDLTINVGFFVR